MDTNIYIITNDEEHAVALKAFDEMAESLGNNPDPRKVAEVDTLGTLISRYEDKRWPVPNPDPVDFIKFMMEQKGLKVKDLAPCFGTVSRAYEVLNRKRNLTLAMIKKLRSFLGCPADALIA